MGDAHDAVAFAVRRLAQQVVGHGVAFFDGDGFFGRFGHGGIVFLGEADIGQVQEGVGMVRFHLRHAFQQAAGFVQPVGLDVDLYQVAHRLEVFLQGQCLLEAFDGVVRTSHALGAHAVILEYLEVLLFVFLLLFFRAGRLSGEE